jgi:two-component system, sensor histidine kinase and response regulator
MATGEYGMSEKPKLLIIDDEEIVLKSTLKILSKADWEIDTARSGEDGLEKYQQKKYDVVVTDLKMPGVGGIEVLKKIKKINPQQIAVVFTGHANVETARDSLKAGAFDYIPKPFTAEEFRDVIHNAIKANANRADAKMLDLMAIVAHEFKSPVSTVQTTVGTLYEGYFGKLTPEQKTGLETVMRNCQYLEDIIRCYIDLSKMELDYLDFQKKCIDFVKEVVAPVLSTPEYQSNLKKMRLVQEIQEVPQVLGDVNLLKIVINNLVNNAIKYGNPDTDIKITVTPKSRKVVFSIRNEGVGIAAEDIQNRLFKRFERLKQRGTEGVKGSGLGLYICQQIVEKHRGEIEVNSQVGQYVQFVVTLNVAG